MKQIQSNSNSDDDDIPLGQKHPEALKLQAKLRSNTIINNTKNNNNDDNQPLVLLKRLKSISKQKKKSFSPNHTNSLINQPIISIDLLIQKLELVKQFNLKPTVLNSTQKLPTIDTRIQSNSDFNSKEIYHHIIKSPLDQFSSNSIEKNTKSINTEFNLNNKIKSINTELKLNKISNGSDEINTKISNQNQIKHHQILNSTSPVPSIPLPLIPSSSNQKIELNLNHSPIQLSPQLIKKKLIIKLAILNPSQSIMVEINQDTLPKDLLKKAKETGQLIDENKKGTWGLFEVWRDLEIERPIREIEKIINLVETWTSVDTNETYLLIQKSDISGLSISNRSFTSGIFGGNLWCELKPGKWSKKFVLLRDNIIYLCSNDKGKDEMFLCTMEKFDVYSIPNWAHKNLKGVPREYSFGVKSLNKFSFFETKSDFVHKFSCKDKLVQLDWIRRLYDARTYIVMSQSGEDEMNRTKSTDSTHTRNQVEKSKSTMGLKRGKTLLASRNNERQETISLPKLDNGIRSEPMIGNSSLTRKPTLVKTSMLTKFKQGTLLGNLEHQSSSNSNSNGLNHLEESHLPAILPPHVMPLTNHENNNNPSENITRRIDDKLNNNTTISTSGLNSMNKPRTWEQMGSEERKLYLNQVQNQAKLEGRTLLHFQNDNLDGCKFNNNHHHHHHHSGLLAGLIQPSHNLNNNNNNNNNSGLNRSKTLGSHRSKPNRPTF